MSLPFEGIRVVEAAQMVAGPLAGMVMAEQGADVIKVELPDGVGDRMRFLGSRRGSMSAIYHGVNRGKRSVVLDSKHPEGVAALRRLIGTADVFVQNFRPGAADRLGIGADDVLAEHPRLVYVSVSGYGPTGPRAGERVYDYVIQAMSGMAAVQGRGGRPELARHVVIDKVTALTVSQAIAAALFQRERTGRGQHVELSMLDTGLWFFWPDGMMDRALQGDDVVDAPHFGDLAEVLATSDGHVTAVAMGGRTWPNLVAAFNPAWSDDPRYATARDREAHQRELAAELAAIVGAMTTDECLARMHANDIPGARVLTPDEVPLEPQVVHNDSLIVHDNGPVGTIREARPPVRFGGAAREVPGPAPEAGEHTDEILSELGYDAEAIATLRDDGVLGPPGV